MDSNKPNGSIVTLPMAIIIAGALIAVAIIWIKKPATAPATAAMPNQAGQTQQVTLAPITAADHILGNPDASVKIVEFSDPSCPYCKLFNPTMVEIMNDYGASGKVAWIYRDFPLDQPASNGAVLHPNAGREADAMECAATVGGNDDFWKYEEEWYQNIPEDGADRSSADDQKQIVQDATDTGLNLASFDDCLSDPATASKVSADYQDGLNAGVTGTPTSILITPSGTDIPLEGVQSYATLKTAIDALLDNTPSQ